MVATARRRSTRRSISGSSTRASTPAHARDHEPAADHRDGPRRAPAPVVGLRHAEQQRDERRRQQARPEPVDARARPRGRGRDDEVGGECGGQRDQPDRHRPRLPGGGARDGPGPRRRRARLRVDRSRAALDGLGVPATAARGLGAARPPRARRRLDPDRPRRGERDRGGDPVAARAGAAVRRRRPAEGDLPAEGGDRPAAPAVGDRARRAEQVRAARGRARSRTC